MPAALTIPKVLTDADWQKQKGVVAKMAGETGIGGAMKKLATSFGAIDFTLFDAKMACPGAKTTDVVKAGLNNALAHHKDKVGKARADLVALRDLAAKVAVDFKKNKLIPSSSTKHVESIQKAADDFYMALKDNSVYFTESWKTFETLTATLGERAAQGSSKLSGYVTSIENDGRDVVATPTADKYIGKGTTGFHQGVRGLSAALATQTEPGLKQFYGIWKPLAQDSYKPKADASPDVVKAKVKEVLATLAKLKPLLK